MDYSTGKLAFIVIVALLLSCGASWWVAHRYRVVMRRLMSAPLPSGAATVAAPEIGTAHGAPVPVSVAGNRAAGVRLTLLLAGLSCLMALTSASLWLVLAFPSEPFAPKRAAVLALMHLWPVFPALGLLWRWSISRVLAALALWALLCFGVMLWRSIEPRPLELLLGLAVEIGPSLVLVALLCTGNATRAVAPWLMPPFVVLAWASTAGFDLLGALVERRSPLLVALTAWSNANVVMLLFVLLPWLIAAWPLRRAGRALARAYARKQLSELMVLFTAVWTIALLVQALSVASSAGLSGLLMFAPLPWIPLVMVVYRRTQARSGRPPTLLVLRVFQRDVQVQALFDHVVERWRLSGNTVLIAGTDLADRTLDADDIYTFLDGGLAARFIRTPADVPARLAAFDLDADAEGRFRVNECYCHDTTWQAALHALVARSDVVLMDLRSFRAHNAGCRYELGALAQAAQALRVVVLTDGQTDRAAAAEAVAHAAAGRFVWLDTATIDARTRRAVLASLFDPAPRA